MTPPGFGEDDSDDRIAGLSGLREVTPSSSPSPSSTKILINSLFCDASSVIEMLHSWNRKDVDWRYKGWKLSVILILDSGDCCKGQMQLRSLQ